MEKGFYSSVLDMFNLKFPFDFQGTIAKGHLEMQVQSSEKRMKIEIFWGLVKQKPLACMRSQFEQVKIEKIKGLRCLEILDTLTGEWGDSQEIRGDKRRLAEQLIFMVSLLQNLFWTHLFWIFTSWEARNIIIKYIII